MAHIERSECLEPSLSESISFSQAYNRGHEEEDEGPNSSLRTVIGTRTVYTTSARGNRWPREDPFEFDDASPSDRAELPAVADEQEVINVADPWQERRLQPPTIMQLPTSHIQQCYTSAHQRQTN